MKKSTKNGKSTSRLVVCDECQLDGLDIAKDENEALEAMKEVVYNEAEATATKNNQIRDMIANKSREINRLKEMKSRREKSPEN